MTIGYFGIYHPGHPRNVVFIECLRRAGYRVLEINDRTPGIKKYFSLGRKLRHERKNVDCLIVGFPGQQAVLLAKLLYRGPIIFNPLLSLYDAIIGDREDYSRWSFRALYFWLLDFLSVHAADHVILDHNAHIDYFARVFGLPQKKTSRIFLGADEAVFRPLETEEKKYEIHYYSSFIPVHGTDTIIKAAKLLEADGVTFVISGRGQCYDRDRKLAEEMKIKNIQFIDKLKSKEDLNRFINSSWVSLGLFASVPRTDRSIASKVFEAICCGRPVITEYTEAGAELLKDKESVLFVRPNDSNDLAEKIRLLKKDNNLRLHIAKNARKAYEEKASFSVIINQLKSTLSRYGVN